MTNRTTVSYELMIHVLLNGFECGQRHQQHLKTQILVKHLFCDQTKMKRETLQEVIYLSQEAALNLSKRITEQHFYSLAPQTLRSSCPTTLLHTQVPLTVTD